MTRQQILAETFQRFARVRRRKPADVVVVVVGMALAAAGMPSLGNADE